MSQLDWFWSFGLRIGFYESVFQSERLFIIDHKTL